MQLYQLGFIIFLVITHGNYEKLSPPRINSQITTFFNQNSINNNTPLI